MPWSNALLDVCAVFPTSILLVYAMDKMLVMRHRMLFWTVSLAGGFLLATLRSSFGSDFRMIVSIAVEFVVPFALARDRVTRRILVLALLHVAMFLSELLAGVLWIGMTGLPNADYAAAWSNLPVFGFAHFVYLVMQGMLMLGVHALLGGAGRGSMVGYSRVLVWFPVVQVVLLLLVTLVQRDMLNDVPSVYYGGCILMLVVTVVDVLLFSLVRRCESVAIAERRADLLNQQLDSYLLQYSEIVEDIELAARLRHDLHGQTQVAMALIDRWELDVARDHVAGLAGRMRNSEGVA